MSIMVRSGPMPASDSAATTLTLAGNPAAASRAVPREHALGLVQALDRDAVLDEIGRAREAVRRLARRHPHRMDRALGGGRDRVETEQPAGRHHDAAAMLPWRARSDPAAAAARRSSAPSPACRPPASAGRSASSIAAGAHSTARSACAGKSSNVTIGQPMPSCVEPGLRLGRVARRHAGEFSPGMPSASRRASARPIAPRPAMAMRVGGIRTPPIRDWRA